MRETFGYSETPHLNTLGVQRRQLVGPRGADQAYPRQQQDIRNPITGYQASALWANRIQPRILISLNLIKQTIFSKILKLVVFHNYNFIPK